MHRKIILFELNEVPRRILDAFRLWRPRSTLARRWSQMRFYKTYTEDGDWLAPWLTWSSVHRGVAGGRHGIIDFGQNLHDVNEEYPQLWTLLQRHQLRSGICGSLHTYPPPDESDSYAFYLPDVFAAGSECFPRQLQPFQELTLRMIRQSPRNVSEKVPWLSALRLLTSAPALGLRPATVLDVARQLAAERVWSWQKVRRRTYQAVLAFDVFLKQLRRTRPDFCTFFTNHVASAMHRYWAATFPGDYETVEYDEAWIRTYAREIDFAMRMFDGELARLLNFADRNPDYQVWVATSMGQGPTTARPVQSQMFISDRRRFMAALGLKAADWVELPGMFPRYSFRIRPDKLGQLVPQLDSLVIDGRPLHYTTSPDGFIALSVGQYDLHDRPDCVRLGERTVSLVEMGLVNARIDDQSGTGAHHIPEGCLLIYDPRNRAPGQSGTTLSTLELAPALLRNFGVPVPQYMQRGAKVAA